MIGKVTVKSTHSDYDPTLMGRAKLEAIIRDRPGITTPDLAEAIGVSVTIARWMVHEAGTLEFYEGNHIRLRDQQ